MIVGVDIGGTKILALALDVDGTVRGEVRASTPDTAVDLVSVVCDLVRQANPDATAVGIGIAGLIDKRGTAVVSPHLPFVAGYDLRGAVADGLGVPVTVDNDANTAAWGESAVGAGRGVDDLVFVTLGTGIGSGVVCNGKLIRGRHGFGGEAGHMIVDRTGRSHVTGLPGAWEMYGSGTSLGEMTRAAGLGSSGEAINGLVAAGDQAGIDVMETFAREVAIGVASLVAVLDPELVVIGGGVSELGEPLRAAIEKQLPSLLIGAQHRDHLRVVLATLGEQAGAIGAALLAQQSLDSMG